MVGNLKRSRRIPIIECHVATEPIGADKVEVGGGSWPKRRADIPPHPNPTPTPNALSSACLLLLTGR